MIVGFNGCNKLRNWITYQCKASPLFVRKLMYIIHFHFWFYKQTISSIYLFVCCSSIIQNKRQFSLKYFNFVEGTTPLNEQHLKLKQSPLFVALHQFTIIHFMLRSTYHYHTIDNHKFIYLPPNQHFWPNFINEFNCNVFIFNFGKGY